MRNSSKFTEITESEYPQLFQEWHTGLNKGMTLSDFSKGTNRKAWWICEKGHEWEASIGSRTNGKKCDYCSNKKLLKGFNDFATIHPELINEWNFSKNDIAPEDVRFNEEKEVWWKCGNGHSWVNMVSYRSKGYGKCVQCVSLYENFPELLEEWDFSKNTIDPKFIRHGSVEKVYWVGKDCGHSWQSSIRARTRDNHGCPYCAGQKILKGFNDLKTTHPELAKQYSSKNLKTVEEIGRSSKVKAIWVEQCGHEWEMSIYHRSLLKDLSCPVCKSIVYTHPKIAEQFHKEKNKNVDIKFLSSGSEKSVWWKDEECGHEWKQRVISRILSTSGAQCQICINKHVLKGFNDLPSQDSQIFQEWNFEKNTIDPYKITVGSGRKVWWKCSKNSSHEWEAIVSDRHRGSGCPDCWSGFFTSQPEKDIKELIEKYGIKTIANSRKILSNGKELDLCIPEKRIAIEFNGLYWHREEAVGKDYHYDKWNMCKQQGIQLITIWEDDWRDKKEIVSQMLLHKLGVSDSTKIYARKTYIKEISISESDKFLDHNHIQGKAAGSIRLALIYENEIVAVAVFKNQNNTTAELVRYATSKTVIGGFTKLLKYFEKNYEFEEILTFADHSVSDGGLYENNGFVKIGELKPDYSYVVNSKREHKFKYRLKKFKNDLSLQWKEGLTEKELADLNNIDRIYDCGKTKFVKILDK